jgi:hypothetical protein
LSSRYNGQPTPVRHGTLNGYHNRGCRCPQCREANRLAQRAYRAAWSKRTAAGDPAVPHGMVSGYINWICRCEACRQAKRQAGVR